MPIENTHSRVRTVAITTLGCKANQYDSSEMDALLCEAGIETVPFPARADAYIINTCTVTAASDARSRALVRKARGLNPDAVVIVTGCYAQVSSAQAAAIAGVDYILGNPQKSKIVDYISRARPVNGPVCETGNGRDGAPFALPRGVKRARMRARANLKIQEGCSRACSYCVIPSARGASKSLPAVEVIGAVEGLIEAGYREVVLTGIHLGDYNGADAPGLAALGRLLLAGSYPCRFRLSSLDPDEVTDELAALLRGASSICNHVHISIQSCDDLILSRMRRTYNAAVVKERVRRLYDIVPDVAIGADVIAGFPGEGEREFENTFSILEALPLAYLHIFPYSGRRGTVAAGLPAQVSASVKKARCKRLAALDMKMRKEFYNRFVMARADVLVEFTRNADGLLKGRTANYIPVRLEGPDDIMGSMARVRLCGYDEKGMIADGQVVIKE